MTDTESSPTNEMHLSPVSGTPGFSLHLMAARSQSPLLAAHYLPNQERLDCPRLTPYIKAHGFKCYLYTDNSQMHTARPEMTSESNCLPNSSI